MIGTVLGNRYELLEVIGEGGMSTVYKAKCHMLNRFVTVKILKKEYSNDGEFVQKFKREAMAVASLSHTNIVNIYDVGSQGDIHYIVMEYVKGKTLKEVIREEGRLSARDAVKIAIQIGKALDCAHRNNIIHRDIKPHNILMTGEGVIKVTDFGIAKASTSVTITNSSKVLGSAHYFSPEQARGSVVDNRTDIYSLGIVLYELVTGRVPYDAESPVSVALKHIQEPVVPPKQINDHIPESLNKLILKAIEKEPIKRYQKVSDMVSDLKKIQENKDIEIVTHDFDEDATRVLDSNAVNSKLKDIDKNKNKPVKNQPNNKKKILIPAILIMLLVVGLVSGYFAYSKKAPIDVKIPTIVGQTQDDAKKAVEALGLKFVVTSKEKSDKAEGTVLKCYPDEGTTVKKGSEVRVIVSGGSAALTIPNVTNMDVKSAKDVITKAGFTVGTISYNSDDNIIKDNVISQSPDADSNAVKNQKINLIISTGPAEVEVPDLTGKTIDQASAILTNVGLKLGTKETESTGDSSLKDTIMKQSPQANDKVKKGSSVNVTYYVMGDMVTVPNITSILGADNKLSKLGLILVEDPVTTKDASYDNKVISISPGAGKSVPKGTSITVTFYEYVQ
ncbi:MAG: Stk1 family PASTA domain-containing Ser/Thr kinase [Solirubrobacterales bacterium]